MATISRSLTLLVFFVSLAMSGSVAAQTAAAIPPELITPDKIQSRLGLLEFENGAPSMATAEKVRDALAFNNALAVYNNSFRGASALAIAKGLQSIGAQDNTVAIYSKLMDSKSLWLTGNCDTVYYMSIVDLSKGPMVIEQPPMSLGTINDMWFSWIIDIGGPGPDRGEGGKYLLLPPGYDGPLPDSGFHVARSKTKHVLYVARSFLVNNDPGPAVANIKKHLKIYSYQPGGVGTSIATALEGKVRFSKNPPIPETRFVEASGKAFNTIPPSGYGFFEMINENYQREPATSYDVELAGQLAAIGIVHGKPFKPDTRMKKILTDAAAVGSAVGRSLNWRWAFMHPEWAYYENSMWMNLMFEGGASFETPPPEYTKEGMFKPYPPTGARTLDYRTGYYYAYTLNSPGIIMRIPKIGSQYLFGFTDTTGNLFDGAKTYRLKLPKGIPAANFWSLTLYDNQTRSMLDTPQRFPRAGSQTYPTPAAQASADGSTTIYIAPQQPKGVARGNWIQSMPGKGWFIVLRLYGPLETYFSKTWRAGEIELVK